MYEEEIFEIDSLLNKFELLANNYVSSNFTKYGEEIIEITTKISINANSLKEKVLETKANLMVDFVRFDQKYHAILDKLSE